MLLRWPFCVLHQSSVLVFDRGDIQWYPYRQTIRSVSIENCVFAFVHTVALFYTFCLLVGIRFGLTLTFVTVKRDRYIILRDWGYPGGHKMNSVLLRAMPMLYASGWRRISYFWWSIDRVMHLRSRRPFSDRTYFQHICSLGVNFMNCDFSSENDFWYRLWILPQIAWRIYICKIEIENSGAVTTTGSEMAKITFSNAYGYGLN